MKYRTLINRIDAALAEYKREVDALAEKFATDKKRFDLEVQQMREKLKDEYLSQYRRENAPAAVRYRDAMNKAREKAAAIVSYNFDLAERRLDIFFNAPVSPDFAAKVNSAAITGLALSDAEFALLERSAGVYFERRLLAQLAEKSAGEDGAPRAVSASRFGGVELPNIDAAYTALKNFKSSANGVISEYAGENAELFDALENDKFNNAVHNEGVSIAVGRYFNRHDARDVIAVLEPFDKTNEKRTLTTREIKLIDAVIDVEDAKKYPTLTPGKVRKVAEENEDLAELLKLDPRYSMYFADEDGEQ